MDVCDCSSKFYLFVLFIRIKLVVLVPLLTLLRYRHHSMSDKFVLIPCSALVKMVALHPFSCCPFFMPLFGQMIKMFALIREVV